jgi:hypothetical protein
MVQADQPNAPFTLPRIMRAACRGVMGNVYLSLSGLWTYTTSMDTTDYPESTLAKQAQALTQRIDDHRATHRLSNNAELLADDYSASADLI